MSNKKSGLGKGLDSLIPKKVTTTPLAKTSPVLRGVSEESVLSVSLSEIHPNPDQPRKDFDTASLEELAASIKVHGIIQPLIVSKDDSGYQIIAGERRWRAAKMANVRQVPCIVRKSEKHQQLELSLIENIQRKNLNSIEEAVSYQRLLDEFNYTHDELGKRVGKSRPVISNALRLLNLPEDIQKSVINNKINATVGRLLSGMKPEDQKRYYKKALKEKLPSSALEAQAKQENITATVKTYKRRSKNPGIVAKEEELQEILGTGVTIHKNGEIGKIAIQFYSDEEFNSLIEKLKNI